MCTGALIRVLGVFLFSNSNAKFIMTMVGQVLCASMQPLVLSMPTKLAALWFGDKERTIANTIASMCMFVSFKRNINKVLSNGFKE